jgi:ribosomal protein L7Ae-like RNA K-turn-binding protein
MNRDSERRLLGLIGLGMRARNAVVGVEQVRVAARRGTLKVAVVAPDASANSRKKVEPLLAALHIRTVQGPAAVDLGAAVGRPSTAVVGITSAALARGMLQVLDNEGEVPRRNAAARRPVKAPAATKVERRNG